MSGHIRRLFFRDILIHANIYLDTSGDFLFKDQLTCGCPSGYIRRSLFPHSYKYTGHIMDMTMSTQLFGISNLFEYPNYSVSEFWIIGYRLFEYPIVQIHSAALTSIYCPNRFKLRTNYQKADVATNIGLVCYSQNGLRFVAGTRVKRKSSSFFFVLSARNKNRLKKNYC